MGPPVLRVLTCNIWNLMGPWRERRQELVAWIDELAPDIVCLQEVLIQDGRDQATWLAERCRTDWHVFVAGADVGNGIRFGNAVLSRHAIEESQLVDLPGADARDDLQRVCLHARTGGLDVYCTHLAWRFEEGAVREQQVVTIEHFVRQTLDPDSPMPPILAGDFNADPDSAEIRFLSGLQSLGGESTYWQDAWRIAGEGPGLTWDNRNPFAALDMEPERRIDYVFVGWRKDSGAGRVVAAKVVCDGPLRPGSDVWPTDHLAVMAEITTPDPA